MIFSVYLDEFGHDGPFVSRQDPRHNASPIFGLGGFLLPSEKVRRFSTWFYQLKCRLLDFEIQRSGVEPYRWEKKGSALYTTRNIRQYPELRRATFRLLNRIRNDEGMVFYVGIQKTHRPEDHHPTRLFRAILREAIKRLDQFCASRDAQFLLVLDEKDDSYRPEIVEESSIRMFGQDQRRTLIEPPIQAESHLYQTLQCADWLCGLTGRVGCYQALPGQYPDFAWTRQYFSARLRAASPVSGIRLER